MFYIRCYVYLQSHKFLCHYLLFRHGQCYYLKYTHEICSQLLMIFSSTFSLHTSFNQFLGSKTNKYNIHACIYKDLNRNQTIKSEKILERKHNNLGGVVESFGRPSLEIWVRIKCLRSDKWTQHNEATRSCPLPRSQHRFQGT